MEAKKDTNTHSFDWHLACELKVIEKAILVGYFQFWISENETRKSENHFRKGDYWTYTTGAELQKVYPYMTIPSIYRWLDQLEKAKWIKTDWFNDKHRDRTKWYGRGERLIEWLKYPIYQSDKSNSQNDNANYQSDKRDSQTDNSDSQNDKCTIEDTVINPLSTTVINALKKGRARKKISCFRRSKKRKKRFKPRIPPPRPQPKFGDSFTLKSDSEKLNVPYSTWKRLYLIDGNEAQLRKLWMGLDDSERLIALTHTQGYMLSNEVRFLKGPANYLELKEFNNTIINRNGKPNQANKSAGPTAPPSGKPFGQWSGNRFGKRGSDESSAA